MLESQHLVPYCSITYGLQFSNRLVEKQPRCWTILPSSRRLLTKHTLPVQLGTLQCGTSHAHSSSSAGTRTARVAPRGRDAPFGVSRHPS